MRTRCKKQARNRCLALSSAYFSPLERHIHIISWQQRSSTEQVCSHFFPSKVIIISRSLLSSQKAAVCRTRPVSQWCDVLRTSTTADRATSWEMAKTASKQYGVYYSINQAINQSIYLSRNAINTGPDSGHQGRMQPPLTGGHKIASTVLTIPGLYLTGGIRGFDPLQEVADPPQKVLQNLFGGGRI